MPHINQKTPGREVDILLTWGVSASVREMPRVSTHPLTSLTVLFEPSLGLPFCALVLPYDKLSSSKTWRIR